MAESFTFFWKSRLSQWQQAPFTANGIAYQCSEQFMMHAKALLFGDADAAKRILEATTPREQQDIGRTIRGFDESVWRHFREGIVFTGNYERFRQNPDQLELLLQTTGTTLVEASPHDRIWGIGLAADHPDAKDRSKWQGLNLLGEILTRVREVLLWERNRSSMTHA